MSKSKRYTSVNGISMMRGSTFNWRIIQNTPLYLSIVVGPLHGAFSCVYEIQNEILSITSLNYGSDAVFRLKCASLSYTEQIVHSFVEANEFEIMPLYSKED